MIPVPPCNYIMPLHLAGAFFCSLPRKIFLPREEFLPMEVVFAH